MMLSVNLVLFFSLVVDLSVFTSKQHDADVSFSVRSFMVPILESHYANEVMSCTHLVHYRCLKRMLQIEDTYIDRAQGYFLCPVCRRLVSYFPLFMLPTVNQEFRSQNMQLRLHQYTEPINQCILEVGIE